MKPYVRACLLLLIAASSLVLAARTTSHLKRVRWKAALIGAVVCGFIGPGLPLLVNAAFVVAVASSFRDGLSRLAPILPYWVVATIFVGPAAFLLGAAYGVLLQAIAQKFQSDGWVILLIAALLGLGFGSAVPFVSVAIGLRITYDLIGEMRTAGPTGVACGILVFWLFRNRRLLWLYDEG